MPGRNRFSFQPFLTHYILLLTWLLAIIGWFVAFVGMIAGEADKSAVEAKDGALFKTPVFGTSWFGIFVQLGIMAGFFVGIATDSLPLYQLQLCTFGAVALVCSIQGANNIFGTTKAEQSAGAGWLILAIVDIIWLLYLTSEKPTVLNHVLNSTSFNHGPQLVHPSGSKMVVPSSSSSNIFSGGNNGPSGYSNQRSSSIAEINPNRPGGGGGYYSPNAANQSQDVLVGNREDGNPSVPLMEGNMDLERAGGGGLKAKALYAYQASPDDPQEMSFIKGEILEISDNTGKWWQARKQDGTTGICPSNYLQLLP